MSANNWSVAGDSDESEITLTIHRGECMVLLAMNWRNGQPPANFVGFAIEYREPGGTEFFSVKNRLSFPGVPPDERGFPSRESPIQKFRWVHFPRNAELAGTFIYRVSPALMSPDHKLTFGVPQTTGIDLGRETYINELNVAFTRGYVSSQKFAQTYMADGNQMSTLLPLHARDGLDFVPTHPKEKAALRWMGFEASNVILAVLDEALADGSASVDVIEYDLNVPEVLSRLVALGPRLRIIIDSSGTHGQANSAETAAAAKLSASAGPSNVIRQKMGGLQHNKTIVIDGHTCKAVVCGSTNFSWRGFFIQANNAVLARGPAPVSVFKTAFEAYWSPNDDVARVKNSPAANWTDLGLPSIRAAVTFSPHSKQNPVLDSLGKYIEANTKSNVFFALAFLYQTQGAMRDAIIALSSSSNIFAYGMSDKDTAIDLRTADGHMAIVEPGLLKKNVPEPFVSEVSAGSGVQLHHKFIVTDFDTPDARVYMGSFNFSGPADTKNGENLLVINDRRVATAYMVEALRLFDHYEYRLRHDKAEEKSTRLELKMPPTKEGEEPWWLEDWTVPLKIRDRELFAKF